MNERISVIIPSRKRDRETVERAVDSVLNQTYANVEVVLVDDNDEGTTFSGMVRELSEKDGRIRYVFGGGSGSAGAARNKGIAQAGGELVSFLDDDDIYLPEKLEKQMAVMTDDVDAVSCGYYRENLRKGTRDILGAGKQPVERLEKRQFIITDPVSSIFPLVRRCCIEDVGPFWEELRAVEDYELWLRLSRKYTFVCVSEPLAIAYLDGGEHVSRDTGGNFAAMQMIYRRHRDLFRADAGGMAFINRKLTQRCPNRWLRQWYKLKWKYYAKKDKA